MHSKIIGLGVLATCLASLPFAALTQQPGALQEMAGRSLAVSPVKLAPQPLGIVTFPNGKAINLTVALGSGAFHNAADAPGRIWLITDRGPNIACTDTKLAVGLDEAALCGGDRSGRVFPLPSFAPTIYGLDLAPDNSARVTVTLPLKSKNGKPISGLPNPLRDKASEAAFDIAGKPLEPHSASLDPEAIIKLADGTFMIAEQNGPSLLRLSEDGTVSERIVPPGLFDDVVGADYPVTEGLPGFLARSRPARSFTGLALSPDERQILLAVRATTPRDNAPPLLSANIRLVRLDRETGKLLGQYYYRLDEPEKFKRDLARHSYTQSDVRLGEILYAGADQLIVLERIEKSVKLYRVDLAKAAPLPERFDSEQSVGEFAELPFGAGGAGVLPLAKTLLLDSDQLLGIPGRIDAAALLSNRELLLVSDNDFGIDGLETRLVRVTFSEPLVQ